MTYPVSQIELYGRALFIFTKSQQIINIAFEPTEDKTYMVIIFAEDGTPIEDPHDPQFLITLNKILFEFDAGNGFTYDIAAL